MYKRVVIAVDDPALAEAVLTFVLGFAAPPSAEVILLRVVRSLTPGESEASHATGDDAGPRASSATRIRGGAGRDRRPSSSEELLATGRDERR